jgi:hypothetical protein
MEGGKKGEGNRLGEKKDGEKQLGQWAKNAPTKEFGDCKFDEGGINLEGFLPTCALRIGLDQ